MEDLSLHILDIAENSLRAGARNVDIRLAEEGRTLILKICDDGKGMDDEILSNAANPFFTTKESKRFGLGLSLLAQACEETGGNMKITKAESGGIRLTAIFFKDHIDMKPIGDIEKTMRVLKASYPKVRFSFEYSANKGGQS